jgi:hypothetical protein
MSIHEHLPPQARKELKEVGWTKGLELAKVARREGQEFDCATWLHKACSLPKDEFKREVEKELTGRESEPWKNDLQSRYWVSAHGNFAGNQVATKVTISPRAIAGRTIRTITQRVLLRTRFCHR